MNKTNTREGFESRATLIDDLKEGLVDNEMFDIDSFGVALPAKGHHLVRITNYEVILPQQEEGRNRGEKVQAGAYDKKYISLTLKSKKGEVIETRLYPKAVEYFMKNVARQADVLGMKLSEIFRYFEKHDLEIWVDWSSKYGVQVSYYDNKKS